MKISYFIFFQNLLLASFLGLTACDSGGGSNQNAPEPVVCNEIDFPAALKSQISNKLDTSFPLVPGAVVAIYHPDQGYSISSYGVSDTSLDTAMPTNAVFDVGSVHKVFKWVLLEKLVDQELLSFDDELVKHIASPSIPSGKVVDLPYHATGMVDIDASVYDDIWLRTESGTKTFQYTYSEMVDFLLAENDTDITNGFFNSDEEIPENGFQLGIDYSYSSYGPVLAGEIARVVTEDDPLTNLNKYIIDELLLENTSLHGYDYIPDKLVKGYGNDYDDQNLLDPTGEHPQPNQNLMLPTSSAVSGAVFSNACDLTHLSRSISDKSVNYISENLINSRTSLPRDVGTYLKAGRGLVKYHSQYDGNFWVHAGDGAHGHSSLTGYNPDTGMSITVLTNFNPTYMNENYSDSYAAHFEIVQLINDFY